MTRTVYHSPQIFCCQFAVPGLICDSYRSGIDDFDYVDVDWDDDI